MNPEAADFGPYLQSVAERDIDLLLMEELHVDHAFATWFASLAGLSSEAIFDGAWHSLSDQDGETDLLLRVRVGDERVALLIENKIGAPPQSEQDIRYHLRGQRAQEAGRYERFTTAICAPQIYLDGLPTNTAYEHLIPYEMIRDWFERQDGARARWRRAIMNEAVEQGRRGYTMRLHSGRTAFHAALWLLIQEQYPEFIMAKPGPKGPNSGWIVLKGVSFPKEVTFNYKNDLGYMELQFERITAADLIASREDTWPSDIRIVQTGKVAVLRLAVPPCDMNKPLNDQAQLVHTALAAARKLAPLARVILPTP